jgi:hypothetical protein
VSKQQSQWLKNITNCEHRGERLEVITCKSCGSRGKEVSVYHCNQFDKRVTISPNGHGIDYCKKCDLWNE